MRGKCPGPKLAANSGDFIAVTAPACASFQWLLAAVDHIAVETEGSGGLRLLLDLSAVTRPPGMVERSIFSEHLARHLAYAVRVASVVVPGTKCGVAEAVARRLNLDLRVFTSRPEAVRWLSA